jgi:hypothetical protein
LLLCRDAGWGNRVIASGTTGMLDLAIEYFHAFDNRIHGGQAIQHPCSPLAANNCLYLVYTLYLVLMPLYGVLESSEA